LPLALPPVPPIDSPLLLLDEPPLDPPAPPSAPVPGVEFEPPVLTGGEVEPPFGTALAPPFGEVAPPFGTALAPLFGEVEPPLGTALAPLLAPTLAPPAAGDAPSAPPAPAGPDFPLELAQAAASATASGQIISLQQRRPLGDAASAS